MTIVIMYMYSLFDFGHTSGSWRVLHRLIPLLLTILFFLSSQGATAATFKPSMLDQIADGTAPHIQLAQIPRRSGRRRGILSNPPFVRRPPTPENEGRTNEAKAVKITNQPSDGKKPIDDDTMVNIDLQGADLRSILKLLAELTSTIYLYDENLRGKANLIGPQRLKLKDAIPLLESILEYKGYTFVKMNGFKKVILRQKGMGAAIETHTSYPPSGRQGVAEKLVTQLVQLEHTNVNDIKAAVSGFLATPSSLVAHPQTNTLIVTDSIGNIERLLNIIKELDVPVRGQESSHRAIEKRFCQGTSRANRQTSERKGQ